MGHKTTELKFNQGGKWIPGSLGQGSRGASAIDYINEMCENNINNLGCAMAIILNVFSYYFLYLGCCCPDMEFVVEADEAWLIALPWKEWRTQVQIHSRLMVLGTLYRKPYNSNHFSEITYSISMGQRALLHAWLKPECYNTHSPAFSLSSQSLSLWFIHLALSFDFHSLGHDYSAYI